MSVFHLKYRPQKISDLDLSEVAVKLKKILAGKEIPQSFLFAGPKGAGKTSAARIVARAVNCSQPKDGEPCGKCDNCKEVERGSCIDVIEMDAASNRGIEDIRLLKDRAFLLPSKLRRKVFIIDEVHMLTKEAFNALLKLIEEPPEHTYFILCTTDEGKIPETVLSRLVKINFSKGNREELKRSLMKVVKGEKIEIEDPAVELVVEKSDGSFRNLQKTFNEIVLQFGGRIGIKEAISFFEQVGGGYGGEEFENDLKLKAAGEIMKKLEKMAAEGVDFKRFREGLIEFFQKRLLGFYGIGEQKSELALIEVEKLLGLLIAAGKQEKEVEIDQLPLELAVAEFVGENKDNRGDGGEKIRKITSFAKDGDGKGEKKLAVLSFGVEKVEGEWSKILEAVKPYNHSVEAFLRAARPKSMEGSTLKLEVFYPFHKDKLEEEKNRKIVERGLAEVLGEEVRLCCVLGKSRKKAVEIKNETPVETSGGETGDIYDVAKQIFG